MLGFLASTSAFISMMCATQDLITAAPRISCLVMALGVFLHQVGKMIVLCKKKKKKTF
jgi:hypothetical protein